MQFLLDKDSNKIKCLFNENRYKHDSQKYSGLKVGKHLETQEIENIQTYQDRFPTQETKDCIREMGRGGIRYDGEQDYHEILFETNSLTGEVTMGRGHPDHLEF